jgi:hypothetical protein
VVLIFQPGQLILKEAMEFQSYHVYTHAVGVPAILVACSLESGAKRLAYLSV